MPELWGLYSLLILWDFILCEFHDGDGIHGAKTQTFEF